MLAPCIATNWWPVAQAGAELLEGWGRAAEAIAPARPYAQAGDRPALVFFARLPARHGGSGEAFGLLRSGVRLGRVEDAVRVLQQPRTRPAPPTRGGAHSTEPPC
ncbi:hypothetical protein HZZ00_13145 [Streptomyces sp. NEAU-sy36]|uniref:hypothetical protein n=1 Tax=unclassified Streptomyces TaxID=2593676 RepID=UPI0015D597AB|nr:MULTISPECIES: hypothetical protein [unclassified Streptomyces]QLJ01881.1 hypothetical protein HZZ00_13145 [Streptomyces sp. NEAU-sy36]